MDTNTFGVIFVQAYPEKYEKNFGFLKPEVEEV